LTLLHQCQGATGLFAKQEHQQHKGCEKDDDANRRMPVHAETMRISYSRIDASGCTCQRYPRLTIARAFCVFGLRLTVALKCARKTPLGKRSAARGGERVQWTYATVSHAKFNLNCAHWIPLTWYYYGSLRGREMAPGDRLRCEYLALSIIPTG
jgi:hypothetical protein